MPQKQSLVEALGLSDTNRFRLDLVEAIGWIALIAHRMRGILVWLDSSDTINFKTPSDKATYNGALRFVSEMEEYLWELAPSRAALLELRKFRLTGELEPDFLVLFAKDNRGRIPETPESVIDTLAFRGVLDRLKDYEDYKDKGKPPTTPD